MASCAGVVHPVSTRCWPAATKSLNVFFFFRYLPSVYQCRPISPPPRMCAIANAKPRSSSDSRADENDGSLLDSYEP